MAARFFSTPALFPLTVGILSTASLLGGSRAEEYLPSFWAAAAAAVHSSNDWTFSFAISAGEIAQDRDMLQKFPTSVNLDFRDVCLVWACSV